MRQRFHDRKAGGRLLAGLLGNYQGIRDGIVLGLPRGGVLVAEEVARVLHLPLDIFVVRKIGAPFNEELALGAIASGGVRVLNADLVERLGIHESTLEVIAAREQRELERRERAYRQHHPPPELKGRKVILVDDGIATGATMRAALQALREIGAARIIVAAPVMAPEAYREFSDEADEVAAVMTPDDFSGVGQWYENFRQTSDEEVCQCLDRARQKG